MITDLIPSSLQPLAPWSRRDVFSDFQRSMNRMMRDFFAEEPIFQSLSPWEAGASSFSPRLDLQETEDKMLLSAELPGLDDKDVEVTVDRDCLTIRGEKREEKEAKGAGRSLTERRYGAFERTVRLPSVVEKEKISAKFDRGILTIELPKSAEAKREYRKIPIKH